MPPPSNASPRSPRSAWPSSRWWGATLLALSGLSATVLASTQLVDGYTVRLWQTEDGLPQNLVTSAVQTRDGYLWFGTSSGLARFNGQRFVTFDAANTPQIEDRRITRLFEDAKGTLWIGQESGALTSMRNGRFETVAVPSGVIGEKIIGLGSDAAGKLWAMHENGAVSGVGEKRVIPSMLGNEPPALMGWGHAEDGRIFVMENNIGAAL